MSNFKVFTAFYSSFGVKFGQGLQLLRHKAVKAVCATEMSSAQELGLQLTSCCVLFDHEARPAPLLHPLSGRAALCSQPEEQKDKWEREGRGESVQENLSKYTHLSSSLFDRSQWRVHCRKKNMSLL